MSGDRRSVSGGDVPDGSHVVDEVNEITAEIIRLREKQAALNRRRAELVAAGGGWPNQSITALLKSEVDKQAEGSDYGARHETVVSTVATLKAIDEELVEERIAHLRKVGEIYEPREGFWRRP